MEKIHFVLLLGDSWASIQGRQGKGTKKLAMIPDQNPINYINYISTIDFVTFSLASEQSSSGLIKLLDELVLFRLEIFEVGIKDFSKENGKKQ